MKINSDILAYRDKLIKSDSIRKEKNYIEFKNKIQNRKNDSPNIYKVIDEVRGK